MKERLYCSCNVTDLEIAMTCFLNDVALPLPQRCLHLDVLELFDDPDNSIIGKLSSLCTLFATYNITKRNKYCAN